MVTTLIDQLFENIVETIREVDDERQISNLSSR